MSVIQSERSPLASLVLFMICLSIFGSVVAGVHYFAVDLPVQKAGKAPANSQDQTCHEDCANQCSKSIYGTYVCYISCVKNC